MRRVESGCSAQKPSHCLPDWLLRQASAAFVPWLLSAPPLYEINSTWSGVYKVYHHTHGHEFCRNVQLRSSPATYTFLQFYMLWFVPFVPKLKRRLHNTDSCSSIPPCLNVLWSEFASVASSSCTFCLISGSWGKEYCHIVVMVAIVRYNCFNPLMEDIVEMPLNFPKGL